MPRARSLLAVLLILPVAMGVLAGPAEGKAILPGCAGWSDVYGHDRATCAGVYKGCVGFYEREGETANCSPASVN